MPPLPPSLVLRAHASSVASLSSLIQTTGDGVAASADSSSLHSAQSTQSAQQVSALSVRSASVLLNTDAAGDEQSQIPKDGIRSRRSSAMPLPIQSHSLTTTTLVNTMEKHSPHSSEETLDIIAIHAEAANTKLLLHHHNSIVLDVVRPTLFKMYNFDEIPAYLQDNEYICNGYRANYSFRESWASILRCHNESGNIWTHLLGFLFFLILLATVLTLIPSSSTTSSWWQWGSLPAQADQYDRLIFAVYLISACGCFAFSTLFHTHFCTSRKAFIHFGCLDYAGISLLISGSAAIITFYAFYCPRDHSIRSLYLGLLVLVSLVGVIGPVAPIWATARFRIWRTLIYIASGALATLPIVHFLLCYGMPSFKGTAVAISSATAAAMTAGPPVIAAAAIIGDATSTVSTTDIDAGVGWWGIYGWLVMIGLYITGAFVYASKVPERYAPGRFDYILHSHQIWHVCVVSAALVHYWSAKALLVWRLESGLASCPTY